VDILSNGRLRLGVGTGLDAVDYEAMGADFQARGRRQEEQVHLLRALWTQEIVDFQGEFHRVDRGGISPLPARAIPIWFGGGNSHVATTHEAAMKRAARLGDGWIPLFRPDDPESAAAVERMGGYLREAGRDPATFGIEGFVHAGGNPERWCARLEAWRTLGATHVTLRTIRAGLERPRDHFDAIARYMEAVKPLLAGPPGAVPADRA
jgi:alkanesulfonate monooxygenase SsuD/methylene tetrahydromethanopterin reductase-like flavin-dependent oxidoreductase (luciferase family)